LLPQTYRFLCQTLFERLCLLTSITLDHSAFPLVWAGTRLAFSSRIDAWGRAVTSQHSVTKSDGATTKVKRPHHGVLICSPALTPHIKRMKPSDILRKNAEDCLRLADGRKDQPSVKRFHRMAAGWLALAREQDWLDGVIWPHSQRHLLSPQLSDRINAAPRSRPEIPPG